MRSSLHLHFPNANSGIPVYNPFQMKKLAVTRDPGGTMQNLYLEGRNSNVLFVKVITTSYQTIVDSKF